MAGSSSRTQCCIPLFASCCSWMPTTCRLSTPSSCSILPNSKAPEQYFGPITTPATARKQSRYGEKETFHLAFRKMKQSYRLVHKPIHRLEGTMCQHDFQGRRIFQHRNTDKWS